MLESERKGYVYQVSSYTFKDKESDKVISLINIKYIFKARDDDKTRCGYDEGYINVPFSQELFDKLKSEFILKSVVLHFRLEVDYKDSDKYNSKLYKINDLVLKQ